MKPLLKGRRIQLLYTYCLTGAMTLLLILQQAAAAQLTVVQFGAIPNDGMDDTDAMQKAADELCKPENQGTTLLYPPGVYNVDKLVDYASQYLDPTGIYKRSISYTKCRNVKITGVGAKIEVKGNFEKKEYPDSKEPGLGQPPYCHGDTWPQAPTACAYVAKADIFQRIPFAFVESDHFTLSGFEIDGNVDQMTQADPTVYFIEGGENGVVAWKSHDYVLKNLNVHHMATDGIIVGFGSDPGDHDVTLDHVTLAHNGRNDLSIAEAWNVQVLNSKILNAGFSGPAKNNYTAHGPGTGVDVEAHCLPADADWGLPQIRREGCRVYGNILFNRVTATGSFNGQIAFPHGESSAFVVVRNSTLQNTKEGRVVAMGVVGGVVKNSTLDAQNGYVAPCDTAGDAAQLTSPVFVRYLEQLANDPSPIARKIHREIGPFSSTLKGNTIKGKATLLRCENALPVVTITDNIFQGQQSADVPPSYPYLGYMTIWQHAGGCSAGTAPGWAQQVTVEGNKIFIPWAAPAGQFGQDSTTAAPRSNSEAIAIRPSFQRAWTRSV
jgi:hypothetical protein